MTASEHDPIEIEDTGLPLVDLTRCTAQGKTDAASTPFSDRMKTNPLLERDR
jgi:hypothetical protein